MIEKSVWIGFDPREAGAFAVARASAAANAGDDIEINGLVLEELRALGIYSRPTSRRDGRIWDDISEAPCATEFSISRFLVPQMAADGLALFMDADVLVRSDLGELFDLAAEDSSKAVWVVKHDFAPPEGVKMDGQIQTVYARKNWSSVMLFNLDHPANKRLTVDMVNTLPGRDLHRFCWLKDEEIGELDPAWNWLVGHSDISIDPKIVHFTDGVPFMPGYETCDYADEFRLVLSAWAA